MVNVSNRFGENRAKVHKCSICKQRYTVHDPKNPNRDKKNGSIFRFPHEWTENEVVAHKLSHIKSPKARRILGKILKLPEDIRGQVLDFVTKHYAD